MRCALARLVSLRCRAVTVCIRSTNCSIWLPNEAIISSVVVSGFLHATGEVQTGIPSDPHLGGTTGYHTVVATI